MLGIKSLLGRCFNFPALVKAPTAAINIGRKGNEKTAASGLVFFPKHTLGILDSVACIRSGDGGGGSGGACRRRSDNHIVTAAAATAAAAQAMNAARGSVWSRRGRRRAGEGPLLRLLLGPEGVGR